MEPSKAEIGKPAVLGGRGQCGGSGVGAEWERSGSGLGECERIIMGGISSNYQEENSWWSHQTLTRK